MGLIQFVFVVREGQGDWEISLFVLNKVDASLGPSCCSLSPSCGFSAVCSEVSTTEGKPRHCI